MPLIYGFLSLVYTDFALLLATPSRIRLPRSHIEAIPSRMKTILSRTY